MLGVRWSDRLPIRWSAWTEKKVTVGSMESSVAGAPLRGFLIFNVLTWLDVPVYQRGIIHTADQRPIKSIRNDSSFLLGYRTDLISDSSIAARVNVVNCPIIIVSIWFPLICIRVTGCFALFPREWLIVSIFAYLIKNERLDSLDFRVFKISNLWIFLDLRFLLFLSPDIFRNEKYLSVATDR